MFNKHIKLIILGTCLAYLVSCSGDSAIRASYEEHSKACENALEAGNNSVALESCQQAYNDTQQGKFDDEIKSAALNNLSTANRNAEIFLSYEQHTRSCENALGTGNNIVALEACQQAYEDTQQGKFNNSIRSAALYNISTANRNAEKLDQALVYLKQSITLEEKSGESNGLGLARRLSNLATIYAQLGDFYLAIPVVLRLIPIVEKKYTNEWQWLPIMLDDFVTEAIKLNQQQNAQLLQEASNRLKSK